MDGETFLRRYADAHARELQSGSDEDVGVVLSGAEIVAEALVSVGALDEEVAQRILAALRDRANKGEGPGLLVAPMGGLGTTDENGPYHWGPITGIPPAPALLRVIPVQQDGVVEDQRITVISLEIWTDHMTLRSMITAEADRFPDPLLWAWRVRDDRGGIYNRGGGHSGGDNRTYFIENDFVPAPEPEVRTVILSARRLEPIHDVDPVRMVPVTGFTGEELLRFEVPL